MSGEALKSDSSPEVENGYDISETLERVYAMRNKDEAYDLAHELDEAGLGANAKIAGAFRERSRLLEARNNIIGSIKRTSSLDKLQERRQEIEKLIEEDNVSLNEDDIEMVRAAFDETEGNLSQDDVLPDDGKIEDLMGGPDAQNDTDSKKESPADIFVRKVQNAQREFDEARNQGGRVEVGKTEETKPEAKVADFSEIEKGFEDLKKEIDAQFDQLQAEIKTKFDRLLTQEYYVWMKDEQRIAKIKYENGVWFEDFGQKSKQALRDRADAVRQTIIEDIDSGVSGGVDRPVENKKDIGDMANRIHQAVMGVGDVDAQGEKGQSAPERAKVHVEPILVEGDNTLKGAVDLLADYFVPAVDEQDKDLSRGARITEFFDSRGKSEQPKENAEAIAGVGDDKLKGAVDLLADYFVPAVDEQDKDLSRGARITEFFNSDARAGENNAVNSDAGGDVDDADKKENGKSKTIIDIDEGAKNGSKTPFYFKFYFDKWMMPKEKNGEGLTIEKAIGKLKRSDLSGVSMATVEIGFRDFLFEQNGGKNDEKGKIIRGSDGFLNKDGKVPEMRSLLEERYEELGLNTDGTEKPEGERSKKKIGFSLRKAFIKSQNRR